MTHRNRRRSGFSLLEMLIVLVALVLLIALLLPALQSTRSAARKTTCANHLHQWGIAYSSYREVTGTQQDVPPTQWGVTLLPYVEGATKTWFCPEGEYKEKINAFATCDIMKTGVGVTHLDPFSEGSIWVQRLEFTPPDPNHYRLLCDSGSVPDWNDFIFDVVKDPLTNMATMTVLFWDSPLHEWIKIYNPDGSLLITLNYPSAVGQVFTFPLVESTPPGSFGMNSKANQFRSTNSNKILLLDYNMHTADLAGPSFTDDWYTALAARHKGTANVLYTGGHVVSHRPEEITPLDPDLNAQLWAPD